MDVRNATWARLEKLQDRFAVFKQIVFATLRVRCLQVVDSHRMVNCFGDVRWRQRL